MKKRTKIPPNKTDGLFHRFLLLVGEKADAVISQKEQNGVVVGSQDTDCKDEQVATEKDNR